MTQRETIGYYNMILWVYTYVYNTSHEASQVNNNGALTRVIDVTD